MKTTDIIKLSEFNNHPNFLNSSFFAMIYNLTRQLLQINEYKYLDLCILNDICDCTVEFLGKLNEINTVKCEFFFKKLLFNINFFLTKFHFISIKNSANNIIRPWIKAFSP